MTRQTDPARRSEPVRQTDPRRIRRSRNNVLGLLLAAFVILVFLISMAKMG